MRLRPIAALMVLGLSLVAGTPAYADEGDPLVAPPIGFDLPEIDVPPPPAPMPLGPEIVTGNRERAAVALTFDAGAGAGPALKLLDILRDKQLKSTFFLTGVWARQNPLLVRRIADDGHEIANHTWDHRDLTRLSNAQIEDELARAEDILGRLSGRPAKPLFRFPYGARNERVQALIARLGYRSVYWTVDSLDWMDEASVQSISRRTLNGVSNGSIVLMHVGAMYTSAALPDIIDTLRSRGYSLETVSSVAR